MRARGGAIRQPSTPNPNRQAAKIEASAKLRSGFDRCFRRRPVGLKCRRSIGGRRSDASFVMECSLQQREIVFSSRILRKQANLPRYVVVKPEHVFGHQKAFEALVQLNGCPPFKRNIRPWGKNSEVFFFNLSQPQCRDANLDTGDVCVVSIKPMR